MLAVPLLHWRHITTQPSLSQRQARWVEFISEFDFEIKYLKVRENVVADALSRILYPRLMQIQFSS